MKMIVRLFRIVLALGLASTPFAHADVVKLECTQTGPTEYRLTYSVTGDTHRVQIFASVKADSYDASQPLLTTGDSQVTLQAGKPGERVYFFLKPDHGPQREVSIRHLPLQGTPNFRDLGGYETTDGHFVRWGLIYRSGVLSKLTRSDFAYLGQLGIGVVCDFRDVQENSVAPEIWIPGAPVEHVSAPIVSGSRHDATISSMDEMLAKNPSPAELKKWLTEVYATFAFNNAPEYAKVFAQLKKDRLPLLFHCTAGKDRTGVFSALLLLMLGVPKETVYADYALTDKYLLNARLSDEDSKQLAASSPALARLTPEQRNVMMAADPEYLKSTLRQIDKKYGSFENYRRAALGVSDQDVAVFRLRLLEN